MSDLSAGKKLEPKLVLAPMSKTIERAAGDSQLFQYGDAIARNAAVADQEGGAGEPR